MRPGVLSFLKLAENEQHASLLVKKPDGKEREVVLDPVAMRFPEMQSFVRANAGSKRPAPISFKQNDVPFWFEYFPETSLVYFQFNAVHDKPEETLERFCGRLFAFINDKRVQHLIIDMRNNSGGNNTLTRPLIHGLIRNDLVNRLGHLFVLIGRTTFSAAMNCAVEIERNTNAVFVGEPTGSSPNFVGETTILALPCSGLRVSCSSLYWQSSTATDRRAWIAPSIYAEPSIAAFRDNRDPGLEAIFAYLDSHSSVKE